MKKFIIAIIAVSTAFTLQAKKKSSTEEISNGRGFYKDIFMDSGINLTSRTDLPSARFLNKEIEFFASHVTNTQTDTILQSMIMGGSTLDENGILLYPDGAPRFRMIYMNGGRATRHGFSLGEKGLGNIRQFIKNGGSYVGTCAGAYLSCKYYKNRSNPIEINKDYSHIWPGMTSPTGISKSRHGVVLEKKSPLLKYYDFGGDMRVDSVYHNGGCWANPSDHWPKGTEILARYDTRNLKGHEEVTDKIVMWAYKENDITGRVVASGSHPEGEVEGERLQLMSAMARYAMDGNGKAQIKGELTLGEERQMTASTHDNNPAYTKIGDKQYHHFTITVPEGLDTLTIRLKPIPGYENYDMYLFADRKDVAWKETAEFQTVSLGFDKSLRIDKPKAGKYFISVYCATTVSTMTTEKGTQYYGRTDVLNGVPYIIGVNLPIPQKEEKKTK